MRVPYFHCAPIPLTAGSIIEPGNWGRIINSYSLADMNSMIVAFRETLLENARLKFAPDKPSRLNCIFACPSAEGLRSFCQNNGRIRDIAYQVEPIDLGASIHAGDYNLATLPILLPGAQQQYFYMKELPQRFKDYWQGVPTETVEILIGGPVRIVDRLPDPS